MTILDLCAEINISRRTFCNYFPEGSEGSIDVYDALEQNKSILKREIRQKLLENKNPVALISLYKILGTPEEIAALGGGRVSTEEKIAKDANIELQIK